MAFYSLFVYFRKRSQKNIDIIFTDIEFTEISIIINYKFNNKCKMNTNRSSLTFLLVRRDPSRLKSNSGGKSGISAAGPGGPGDPIGPSLPLGPSFPVTPFGPTGPASPGEPIGPSSPFNPVKPMGP